MNPNNNLEEWYEETVEISPKQIINSELDRLGEVFNDTGNQITPADGSWTQKKRLAAIAVGKAVAHAVGKREENYVTIEEVFEVVDMERKVVTARLSELASEGYLKQLGEGKYVIEYSNLPDVLDYILE